MAEYLRDSQAPLATARRLDAEMESLRKRAFTAFDTQKRDEGEQLWAEVLKRAPEVQHQYAQASQALDMAAGLEPSRADIREQLAHVLCERVGLAEREHNRQQLAELEERLAAYTVRAAPRPCAIPARLRLLITPPGAQMTIAKYVLDERQKGC